LNGSRLGFYEPFRRSINRLVGFSSTDQVPVTSIAAGAASGAIGACLGNPLFLIKARMQAYSPALPVGAQHYYKSSFDAFRTIWRAEKARGLIRGIDAAVLRTSMGSSVQLPSYNWTKNQIVSNGLLPANSIWTYLASSSVSGICVCIVMQPADTVNRFTGVFHHNLTFFTGINTDVQPADHSPSKWPNARDALQESNRLPVEDYQD